MESVGILEVAEGVVFSSCIFLMSLSHLPSTEHRRVDLAGMFGCLADAGDAGVKAVELEMSTCMKEADEWSVDRCEYGEEGNAE